MITDDFLIAGCVILFIWSATLLWASWQLCRVARGLDREREELTRWKRLHNLAQRQNVKWQ